jgi:GrpB-like predicted nucleotidyltransferase (UPF0157 family)
VVINDTAQAFFKSCGLKTYRLFPRKQTVPETKRKGGTFDDGEKRLKSDNSGAEKRAPDAITVIDYDPAWRTQFKQLRSIILPAIGDAAVAIEHVGSTAVPGLAAKPIIDIDVVVASPTKVSVAIERLAVIGYEHHGNLSVEGREAFGNPPGSPWHHVYVCVQGGTALQNHLALRDYLRSNSGAVAKYGQLKRQLATRFPTDIARYIDGKTDFILKVLRTRGLTDNQLIAIDAVNRLKP